MINPISPGDLEEARLYWTKHVQGQLFWLEIQSLKKGEQLGKSHPLARLTPWVDPAGVLRVGGRLQNFNLNAEARHPIILSRRHHFTDLIILDALRRTLHGGTQLTLAYTRNHYWVLGGRAPVRSHIRRCVRCARFLQERAQQLMAPLPIPRVTQSRAFDHTGVDYAGSFNIKTWKGRNTKTYKGYFALFVCLSTSAVRVHLELVSDYTSDAFIAAYKRFTARRVICATFNSDCGTNFKGADKEIRRLFTAATKESMEIGNLLGSLGTQWKFNTPSAAHFGGKWESGVKSVMHHLRRSVGERTFEEMTTFLTQVEATLNSRPLCPLTEDPEDLEALTPGHFLIGKAPNVLPEPSLDHLQPDRLSRWQLVRQALDGFWKHWSTACLQRYLSRSNLNRTRYARSIPAPLPQVDHAMLIRYLHHLSDRTRLAHFGICHLSP
ncbi:uncharacterized protein [Atheta coriaria]|uniref:uncharacterized protein n=1 Tax=Dalotia coriaria TaxID=877792 RepID=UPI0031F3DA5B